MNAHDSEKVVGTLLAQGYSQVETPEDAGLVLYNTCSIRDKAEQKVFNRLQQFKRDAGKGKIFGVLGCVAQQEGEKIFERAPHVSLVCGSASYTKLPRDAGAARKRATAASPGLSLDTDETFDTPFTRRDNPHRAYITIIEGCDKSCAYCVVPFTRGPERSRTSESVMAEARKLAERGLHRDSAAGPERQQLSRSFARRLGFRHAARARRRRSPGIRRVRYHHLASARFREGHRRRDGRQSGALRSRASCRCNRGRRRCWPRCDRLYTRDEYMRRIEWMKTREAQHSPSPPTSSSASPARPKRDFEADARPAGRSPVRFAVQLQVFAAAQHRGAGDGRPDSRGRKERRLMILQEKQRAIQIRRNAELIGGVQEVHGGRPQPGAGPVDRPHVAESHA